VVTLNVAGNRAQGVSEVLGSKWLLQEGGIGESPVEGHLISGHEYNAQCGAHFPCGRREFASSEFGQLHVGNKNMDGPVVASAHTQAFAPVAGLEDHVPHGLQDPPEKSADGDFIVDQKNYFAFSVVE
jgi:hypothetical protein